MAFDKAQCTAKLASLGFPTVPQLPIPDVTSALADPIKRNALINDINAFQTNHGCRWMVAKPARGGSSLGVGVVGSSDEAMSHLNEALERGEVPGGVAVLEAFVEEKVEFTCIVIDTERGECCLACGCG